MKTTKQHFVHFKERCNYWAKEFGLVKWELYFEHKDLNGSYSQVEPSYSSKVATVRLSTVFRNLPKDFKFNEKLIDDYARHEMLHLLINPLYTFARDRYVNLQQIEDADEEIVMLLEKVIK